MEAGNIIVGNITFVESSQSDYEELYEMYNISEFNAHEPQVHFAIIHSIDFSVKYSEEALDKIEDKGLSYLIPSQYNGVVVWENQK